LLGLALAGCPADDPDGQADSSSSGAAGDSSSDAGSPTTTPDPSSASSSGSDGSSGDGSSSGVDESSSSETGTVDSGLELLVCSFGADAVHRFDLDDGSYLGDLGPSDDLDGALGIVVGPDGDIYVASEESNMVLRFGGADGAFVSRFVSDDPRTRDIDESGGLSGPGAVLFGPDDALYVSSFDSDAILRYDGATGAFIDVFVAAGDGGLNGPDAGTVFGPDGDLYVPGYYSNAIARYDGTTGASLGDFTPTELLDAPRTVVFEGEHMYVANEGTSEVLRFDAATGDFVDVFVATGAGGLNGAAGMVFDPSGVLHVASVNNNRVLRFDSDGEPLEALIDPIAAGVSGPTHITIAPAIGG
jgi:DNA-binding beta-propeller fold protein YncE